MCKDIKLTRGVNKLTTNVIGQNDQQAIHKGDIRYENKNKNANAITNKTICLRGSVPTTYVPAPHLEEISTITTGFSTFTRITFTPHTRFSS